MFFVWVIVIGVLQATVFIGLNLLLVMTVFAGMRKGPAAGLLIGASIGMFAGIFSASGIVLTLVLYSAVGLASGIAKAHIFYKENMSMEFMFSLCGMILFYGVCFLAGGGFQMSYFSTALFSALASPLLFRIIDSSVTSPPTPA